MRINEAYEHDPILHYQGEESCPVRSCDKTGTQCVAITAPLTFTPGITVGTPTVTCQGTPVATCETGAEGATCTVTMTQRVCVSVPIQYNVTVDHDDPTIACAGDADAVGQSCGGCC